ncbi:M67 family metallopeptidase [Halobacillus sp. Marseille-Q1614]|uniref:M67 family metallopeptidase n=1 Tax=Halobacillus sp. Marseille-Q1614 TaxID=2709134 RepID=UPI00156EF593|nr:M67 family metallopeptidase [Halobacillus sp. Marseille-Q1614]
MNRKQIHVPPAIYDSMLVHGKSCLPYEACGLLSGKGNFIKAIWPLENEWKTAHRFFVSKQVVEQTVARITQLGEQVLAVYHSHPTTAPVPSMYDIKNHPDPTVKMVILSFKTPTPLTKWFDIQGSTYEECPFFIDHSL